MESGLHARCFSCKKFYRNTNDSSLCSWNNREVPNADDFCSRYEPLVNNKCDASEVICRNADEI